MKDILSPFSQTIWLVLLVIFPIAGAAQSTNIEIQWMPLTDDSDYLNAVLKAAEDYNVDGFQISHNLMHSIDELVYPDRERDMISTKIDQELLVDFTQQLVERGYEAHFWTHEVVGPPPEAVANGKLIIDHPTVLPYTIDKYQQANELLPAMNSVVLTLFETEYKVFDDSEAMTLKLPDNATERTIELINVMLAATDAIDVPLVLRGNFIQSDEIFSRVQGDFVFMVKNTETDWHPSSPLNDFITQRSPQNQELWVEFDLGYEYELRGTVPYSQLEQTLNRLKKSHNSGVNTFVVRLDRYGGDEKTSAIYTPWGQLGLKAFTAFKQDTSFTSEQLIEEWETEHFPEAYELVQLCTRVTETMLFPKMMWFANHSRPPSYGYAKKHIMRNDELGFAQECALNDNLTWDQASTFLINSQQSNEPDSAWYQSIKSDLVEAQQLFSQIEAIQNRHADYFNTHPIWSTSVDRLKQWFEIYQSAQLLYFGIRLKENHPDSITLGELETQLARYQSALEEIHQKFESKEGSQIGGLLWRVENTVTDYKDRLTRLQ